MTNDEKILELLMQMQSQMGTMQGQMTAMAADISDLKTDVSGIKTRLDLDMDKKLHLLAEGQEILKERLDVLDEVKELAEDTKATVDVMYAVVSKHSLDISKLKAKVG